MQILGKRSKILLVVVAIAMLVAVGISFAAWDSMATIAKASNGGLSSYANAIVGETIAFGRYYQTGIKDETTGEYEKTPIEWIVVDKDERIGQLTLMSKYILAAGSYFGNWYYNSESGTFNYNLSVAEIAGNPNNQAYVDSTVRAYLNNLERKDMGGDSYSTGSGFKTSAIASNATTGNLMASVGFSNKKYYFENEYQRPITNPEYKNRPATRGFYDEAFTCEEKAKIVPKIMPSLLSYRWPINEHSPAKMSNIEGTVDKIWIPSAIELNVMNADVNYNNPSDESSTTVFEYFKDKSGEELENALKAVRTPFVVNNSKAMNYSIPVYKYQSTAINEDISLTRNSNDYYWTRSPMSNNYTHMRFVRATGAFGSNLVYGANIGVRPCMILKY